MTFRGLMPALVAFASFAWVAAQSLGAKPPEGRLLFEETFDKGLDNWVAEGPFAPEVKDGRMRVTTVLDKRDVGVYVWCKRELPGDFRAEFDLTPASDSGFFLIFFCAKGVKGEDILSPELFERYLNWRTWTPNQDFDKYTSPPGRKHESRIRCYHISYRRNETANCNLRKNPGLDLVKSSNIRTLLPKGKVARVELVKIGAHITLTVNGEVFMDWTDAKDAYAAGRFGFRQTYDSDGWYDNVKIYDLTDAAAK